MKRSRKLILTSLRNHKTRILAVENLERFGNQMLFINILPCQIQIIFLIQLLKEIFASMYQHGTAKVLSIYEKER